MTSLEASRAGGLKVRGLTTTFATPRGMAVAVDSVDGGGARFVALFPTEPGTIVDPEAAGRPVPDLVE